MSKDDSGGLMSSAGLVRYFDAEDRNAIRIDPRTVVAWGVVFGVVIQMLNAVEVGSSGIGPTIMYGVIVVFIGLTIGLAASAITKSQD